MTKTPAVPTEAGRQFACEGLWPGMLSRSVLGMRLPVSYSLLAALFMAVPGMPAQAQSPSPDFAGRWQADKPNLMLDITACGAAVAAGCDRARSRSAPSVISYARSGSPSGGGRRAAGNYRSDLAFDPGNSLQRLVPTALQLACDEPVGGIDRVVLPAGMGGLVARLLQGKFKLAAPPLSSRPTGLRSPAGQPHCRAGAERAAPPWQSLRQCSSR